MGMTFAKHERIWLRESPDFSESWLHDRISDDPSVLGLGELDVLERERVQHGGGRIDMLLTDGETTPASKWKSCWVRPTRATSYAASNIGTSKGDATQRTIMSPFLSLRILLVRFST